MQATDKIQPTISKVVHGIDRATHLVDQLLTLARSEAKGHEGIAFVQLDLVPITRSVMSECANLALEKNITLSFDADMETARVTGDKALIGIVIRNLFDNAIRYTPDNGRVSVAVGRSADSVELRIEDSGPGIDPGKQELMFQRFQRGDDHSEQGVGLGLFIVKQIVGLHNIDFIMENASPKGGLVVRLVFPKLS